MTASHDEDRPDTADPDPDTSLRMRTAIADAAFIADGIALGLLLKWAESMRPSDDRTAAGPDAARCRTSSRPR